MGEHVPFQLLLGQPWQRENFILIDEQNEGTSLVFKEPSSLEAQYKVLVHQDTPDPSWNFDLTLWVMLSNLENLLLTVLTQLEMDQSNESATSTQIRKEIS